jgi:iron complex outermembrane recepter protein
MLQIGLRWLFVFGLITPALSFGQQRCENAVSGLVEDTAGDRLIGATIIIEALQKGAASGSDGKFTIDQLCPGQYQIRVKYVGYQDEIVLVNVPTTRGIVVKLRASAKILHDVVVEGTHLQQHSLSQSVGILSAEELAAAKGKSLGEMIQQLPGVQTIMTGSAIFKPVIHGLYGQRVAILNNGLRQEGQQWGLEHAPEIDTYIASEIEVVKGAETVRFGADAIGGTIIVKPQPLHFARSFGAEVHSAVTSNNRGGALSGMMEGGFGKQGNWGWRTQGSIKGGGDFHSPEYNLSNTGHREGDVSATLGFRNGRGEAELYFSSFNSTIGILRSAHTGSLSDLQKSIVSEHPWFEESFTYNINNPRQEIGHHLFKVSGQIQRERHTLKAVYGMQINKRKEFDVRRGDPDRASLSLDVYTHTLDLNVDHSKGILSGTVGASGMLKDNFNNTGTGLLPDFQQLTGGLYVIEKVRVKKWLIEGGLRGEHQRLMVWLRDPQVLTDADIAFTYIAASAGASIRATDRVRVASNISLSNRPPHASEMFSAGLHHSAASIERGLMVQNGALALNKDLAKRERSMQWVSMVQYSSPKVFVEWSGFLNRFKNFVFLSPTGSELTIRGYFPVFQYRQTDAMLAGTDFNVLADIHKHLRVDARFSYVYAEETASHNKLPYIPPAKIESSVTYRKSIIGRWKSFYVTLGAQMVLRQVRAPQTIHPEDIAESDVSSTFDFMEAPSAYTLLRMESGIRLPMNNRELGITFSADNLLNQSYRNYMNRLRYYADEVGRNFSLRLSYSIHSH